jgi:riboflavin kinase/FMN adenylyltransferase
MENVYQKEFNEMTRQARFSGIVAHGEKRGRHLGFPTANLAVFDHYDLPLGIYVSVTRILESGNKVFPSISYIGTKPTFDGDKIALETHILDFSQDIYGANIEVDLLKFIRGDLKFESELELAAKMQDDIVESRAFHMKNSHLTK